jgi:hypothetical protein
MAMGPIFGRMGPNMSDNGRIIRYTGRVSTAGKKVGLTMESGPITSLMVTVCIYIKTEGNTKDIT